MKRLAQNRISGSRFLSVMFACRRECPLVKVIQERIVDKRLRLCRSDVGMVGILSETSLCIMSFSDLMDKIH